MINLDWLTYTNALRVLVVGGASLLVTFLIYRGVEYYRNRNTKK